MRMCVSLVPLPRSPAGLLGPAQQFSQLTWGGDASHSEWPAEAHTLSPLVRNKTGREVEGAVASLRAQPRALLARTHGHRQSDLPCASGRPKCGPVHIRPKSQRVLWGTELGILCALPKPLCGRWCSLHATVLQAPGSLLGGNLLHFTEPWLSIIYLIASS